MFIYFEIERHTECEQGRGRERERERERQNPKQSPGFVLTAQNPQTMGLDVGFDPTNCEIMA